MRKILNKIMFRLGYTRYNKTSELLYEMMRESIRRKGEMIETDIGAGAIRVKIAARDIFTL